MLLDIGRVGEVFGVAGLDDEAEGGDTEIGVAVLVAGLGHPPRDQGAPDSVMRRRVLRLECDRYGKMYRYFNFSDF